MSQWKPNSTRHDRPRRKTTPPTETPTNLDPYQFLDHRGWLQPPPFTPQPVAADKIDNKLRRYWHLLEATNELKANTHAPGTRKQYGHHWNTFIKWCEENELCPLPANAVTVATHLAEYALQIDENGVPARDGGNLVQSVSHQSVANRLAAINLVHDYVHLPRPGDDRDVANVLTAVGRTFGVRARNPRPAIELETFGKIVAATRAEGYPGHRNALLVLLRAAGLTEGQMMRLRRQHLHPQDNGDLRVEVRRHTQSTRTRKVTIRRPSGRAPSAADIATATIATLPPRAAAIASKPDGTPLSRAGVRAAIERAATAAGGYSLLTEADQSTVWECADEALAAGTALAVRDTAILTTGWFAALRRSNISALDWEDVTVQADLIVLLIRRSKTDQAGRGHINYLPKADPGQSAPCPWSALVAWRDLLARLLGVPVVALSGPVFPALTKSGYPRRGRGGKATTRITGDKVNDVVEAAAHAAGLEAPGGRFFGAHSLRSGFVTSGLRDNTLTVQEVMAVAAIKTPQVLLDYSREVNALRDNPVAKLLHAAATAEGDDGGTAPV